MNRHAKAPLTGSALRGSVGRRSAIGTIAIARLMFNAVLPYLGTEAAMAELRIQPLPTVTGVRRR